MKDYPFTINYLLPIGKHDMILCDINLSEIGLEYLYPTNNITVKIYAIIYYKNKVKKELYTESYIIKNINGRMDCSIIPDLLNKDLINGFPEYIEIIFTPSDCYPFKWMLNIYDAVKI